MEPHHTHALTLGQEKKSQANRFKCKDCGSLYDVSILARSSQCPHCGNIMMHQGGSGGALEVRDQSDQEPLQEWKADGKAVDEILFRYQNEWQIWNKVVENFGDPNFHFAYLTAITSSNDFGQAQDRYRKHSATMSLVAEGKWQAEIAERMLEKIQMMARLRMEQEGIRRSALFDFLFWAPFTMRHFRVVWLVLGMILLALLGKA